MSPLALLLTQITFSFAALTVLALRLRGWVRTLPETRVLEGLLWMHVPRAVALGVLAPGQALGVPPAVANSIAWGDFISAALALLAIVALHTDRARATRWVWVFTLVSGADIVVALALGIGAGVYATPLGVSWFVLTFYVPLVCISQAAIAEILLKPRRSRFHTPLDERSRP